MPRKHVIIYNTMNAFTHAMEVKSAKDELTAYMDRVLDVYTPEHETLLRTIINLRQEFIDLEEQFDEYIKNN